MQAELVTNPESVKQVLLRDFNFGTWQAERPGFSGGGNSVPPPKLNGVATPFALPFNRISRLRIQPLWGVTVPLLFLFSKEPVPTLENSTWCWVMPESIFAVIPGTEIFLPCPTPFEASRAGGPGNLLITPTIRNGGFETAGATPPAFTFWGQTETGLSTITRNTVGPIAGLASAQFVLDAAANAVYLFQDVMTVSRRYRLSLVVFSTAIGEALTVDAGSGDIPVNVAKTGVSEYHEFEFTAASARIIILSKRLAGATIIFDQVTLVDITNEDRAGSYVATREQEFLIQSDQIYGAAYRFCNTNGDNFDVYGADGVTQGGTLNARLYAQVTVQGTN